MSYLSYLRFFRFNPLLGLLCLYDEMRGERKFGLHTTGFQKAAGTAVHPAAAHAYGYMPSNYVLLQRLFTEINRYPHNRCMLDMGCGKGRAMIVAAAAGFEQISGIELDPALCEEALELIKQKAASFPHTSFTLTCGDAAAHRIDERLQVLFLYNPFMETIMRAVVSNIFESLRHSPRPFWVIYVNPVLEEVFLDAGFKNIYRTERFGYLKACLLFLSS
ncbi:MAG TPA: class I SAM-dependent methyltransferase [Flavisolibacter sp.]|nr:class I SAM-dependent methyltransferase [Flavisolibacter sp.]